MVNTVVEVEMQQPKLLIIEAFESRLCSGPETVAAAALLDGSNVRLNWNIESDMNVHWIEFKNVLSLY